MASIRAQRKRRNRTCPGEAQSHRRIGQIHYSSAPPVQDGRKLRVGPESQILKGGASGRTLQQEP